MKSRLVFKILTVALMAVSCTGIGKRDNSKPYIALVASLHDSTKSKKISPQTEASNDSIWKKDSIAPTKPLYLKNNKICITVGEKTFCITNDTGINYKYPLAGIYEVRKGFIKKNYSLLLNNFVCFTTCDDVGMGYRGYLYAFGINKKKLIKSREFKHNYLHSSAGIFVIDKGANKIFVVNKPEWFDKKEATFTSASMYSIERGHFKFFKNIYENGDKISDDTSLAKFYYKSLSNNGKHGKILPNDWWR